MCSPAITETGRRYLAARGFALIEVIVFIVIVSIAVSGVLSVFASTSSQSAQMLIERQGQQIAKSVLAEVEAMPYTAADTTMGKEGAESRNGPTFFNSVNDYDGFAMGVGAPNVISLKGAAAALPGLADYRVDVAVSLPGGANWNGVPSADVAFIRVTVSTPISGRLLVPVVLQGVRTRYATTVPPA